MNSLPNNNQQVARTVLCVDDDPLILTIIKRMLKPLDYEILATVDPQKGFTMAMEQLPDLIFLDIQMPRMDGFEFLKNFRDVVDREIPVILLSAEDRILPGYRAGCSCYLMKSKMNPDIVRKLAKYFTGELSDEERAEVMKEY